MNDESLDAHDLWDSAVVDEDATSDAPSPLSGSAPGCSRTTPPSQALGSKVYADLPGPSPAVWDRIQEQLEREGLIQ